MRQSADPSRPNGRCSPKGSRLSSSLSVRRLKESRLGHRRSAWRGSGVAIRVAVQERQRFFREGLAMVLSTEPDVEVVASVATAAELVTACEADRPDVVLLEVDAEE